MIWVEFADIDDFQDSDQYASIGQTQRETGEKCPLERL
jgi:hypothetical protein